MPKEWQQAISGLELTIVGAFTAEYALRLWIHIGSTCSRTEAKCHHPKTPDNSNITNDLLDSAATTGSTHRGLPCVPNGRRIRPENGRRTSTSLLQMVRGEGMLTPGGQACSSGR